MSDGEVFKTNGAEIIITPELQADLDAARAMHPSNPNFGRSIIAPQAYDLSALKTPKRKYREKFQGMLMFADKGMAVTDLLDSYGDAKTAAESHRPDAYEIKKICIAEDMPG